MFEDLLHKKIIEPLEHGLGYKFSFDAPASELSLDDVLNALSREPDPVKLNFVVLFLLSAGGLKTAVSVCQKIPEAIKDRLTPVVLERIEFIKMYLNTMSGNRTRDIPFARGCVVACTPDHLVAVKTAMCAEVEKAEDGWYKENIQSFINYMDIKDHWDKPCFSVMDGDGNLVGYIALAQSRWRDDFWDKYCNTGFASAFNLEYYTMPDYRNKGYMKEALPAFLKAVTAGALRYQENEALDLLPEMTEYTISLVYAIIERQNVPSIKTIESLGLFELLRKNDGTPQEYEGSPVYVMRI